jgi:sarcosine oxidase
MPQLLDAIGGKVQTFRQVMFWFEPDGPPDLFEAGRMPVYIRLPTSTSEMFYGLPLLENGRGGMKVAGENFDRPGDPEQLNRNVSEVEKESIHRLAVQNVRIKSGCTRAAVCQYTVTPDFGFVIDHVPDSDRVWFASACSGHGFKHSAAVGEALAGMVTEGRCAFDLSHFRLGRLLG